MTVHNPLIDVQQVLPAAAAGASAIGAQHLINSKLKPPLGAAACIERRALLARLDGAFRRKLVLLAAPIGSGKTTLLTQWYRRAAPSHAVAWLSLDERDNDPVRFFSYLIGAVHGAVPGFDAYPAAALFSESLDRVGQELTIVLDDFQWLTAPSLIRTVDFLLYRSADTVHWIISGRCLPEISLSQLRLADQLLIVDGADLNFDDALIVQLSRKLCRRALSQEEAASIKSRTEGWVAGTKLALLAAAAGPAAPADTCRNSQARIPKLPATSARRSCTSRAPTSASSWSRAASSTG